MKIVEVEELSEGKDCGPSYFIYYRKEMLVKHFFNVELKYNRDRQSFLRMKLASL